jgi:hypothetical protein
MSSTDLISLSVLVIVALVAAAVITMLRKR